MQNQKSKIILTLLVALLVRLIGIASRPIWYDEAFSILFSEKGLGAMLYGTLAPTGAGSADIHPLGYYSVLWLWIRVFGESLVATRILSILAGLVVVLLVYKISLELFDEKTAWLAMIIAALSPFQIHYAQEIRMYALLSMWLLLATFAYLRGEKTGRVSWWIVFAVSSALAQYTHNLAAFYLTALAMIPLFKRDWRTLRSTIYAGFGAIILYLPWLVQLPAQFAKVQQSYWVERPGVSKIFTLLLVYVTNTPVPDNWIIIAISLSLLIIAIGLMQTIQVTRNSGATNGIWTLYLSFMPPALLFLFSQWRPIYIERALLPSGAIFCIWLAWVFFYTNLQKYVRFFLLAILSIAFAMGIYEHITYHDFPYGPFQQLDTYLEDHRESNDIILHSNKLTVLPAILFDRDLPQEFIGDPPGVSTDTLATATQQVLGIQAETNVQSATHDTKRVWYVIFQSSIDEFKANGYSTHPDIEYLNSQYTIMSQKSWDGVLVFLYERKP